MQGHNGERLHVGRWVAVVYHEGFFIGNITALNSEDNIAIDLRRVTKEGKYNWPKKDTDVVCREYIFKAMPWYRRSVREHFNKLLAEYKRNNNKEGKRKESDINPDPPPTKMNRSKKTCLQRYVDMYAALRHHMLHVIQIKELFELRSIILQGLFLFV